MEELHQRETRKTPGQSKPGDGTGNVTAPPDDPGWDHLGTKGGTTVVYVGNRWVLTAHHVGAWIIHHEGPPAQTEIKSHISTLINKPASQINQKEI